MERPQKTAKKTKPYGTQVTLSDFKNLTPEVIAELDKNQIEELLKNYRNELTQEQITEMEKQLQPNQVVQLHQQKSADTPKQEVSKNVSQLDNTPKPQETKFVQALFSIDEELLEMINDFIAQEQRAGVKMWDESIQKDKKINKSLWARDVFKKALKEAKYEPTPTVRRS